MKKTLYSLDESYPNIEIDFEETTAPESTKYSDGEIIMARKTAVVQARKLEKEEVVDTRPRASVDGKTYVFSETKNTAPAGSWVITNPDGEEYVIKDKVKNGQVVATADEQFSAKYSQTPEGYVSTEGPKHFVRIDSDICFKASWGETQFAPKGSYICTEYGPGEEYSVTNSAFDATYQIVLPEDVDTPEA